MKPCIRSILWTTTATGEKVRRWHVVFEDGCGCVEEEDFPDHPTAARFACHVAGGGSRWEFVA